MHHQQYLLGDIDCSHVCDLDLDCGHEGGDGDLGIGQLKCCC